MVLRTIAGILAILIMGFTGFASSQEVTVQAGGTAPVQSGDPTATREVAIATARWNAAKIVLARYLKNAVEDESVASALRRKYLENAGDYILAEFTQSEGEANGLYEVQLSIKLNERRLVADVNKFLSKKSGAAVKPRVVVILADTSTLLSNAIAEEFNARGLFDIKEPEILAKMVGEEFRKKLDAGDLSPQDVDAMQSDGAILRELDFLVTGATASTTRPSDGAVAATLTVAGLRVIDLGSAQVVATTTDSFEGRGVESNVALTNAAVKAAKVLAPRIIDQMVSRWNEMLQVQIEISDLSWFSTDGKLFYEKVLLACKKCRGAVVRGKGARPNSASARLAFKGDLFGFVDGLQEILAAGSFSNCQVSEVDESTSTVHVTFQP